MIRAAEIMVRATKPVLRGDNLNLETDKATLIRSVPLDFGRLRVAGSQLRGLRLE
jgi:hypothetical protein